jgi:hypothetical protein
MFGYAAFAQSTFAGLGGTAFALSISENISLADSSAQASAFLQSVTENLGVDDVVAALDGAAASGQRGACRRAVRDLEVSEMGGGRIRLRPWRRGG